MVRQEDEEEEEEEGGVVQLWSHLWQREGSFLSLNMYRLYNPEPWHRYRHLLPASLCQSTVYTQTSASTLTHTQKKKRGHAALDRSAFRLVLPGPARRFFTQKP